ncbi:hypothetical protein OH76DRAFT_1397993 [Lentinus brumalis]|uniref:Uncharacterized protein n=1 Tax=Lentinus brumalis TaxID=2498619 RepID=A0A371DQ33_9APHY|nr:hypothetical protein OH76DRAFT_1397993 [Polyporus brumalis]
MILRACGIWCLGAPQCTRAVLSHRSGLSGVHDTWTADVPCRVEEADHLLGTVGMPYACEVLHKTLTDTVAR